VPRTTTAPSAWQPDPAVVAATPLGLYVHVPFCERRCGYCAFSTLAVGEHLDPGLARRFLDGAEAELDHAETVLGATRPPLTSIYLGGGTPTMLSATDVGALLTSIGTRFELARDVEISIESNPDGLRPGQLAALRDLGVTRISFGLQSVRRSVLAVLDRTHDPDHALVAVAHARAAGFDHVSLDLIHGTPGERAEDWDATLRAAIDSGIDHVSAYALSVEAGTKLAARVRSGELPRPSDDEAAERYLTADSLLRDAGFDWYELSNWARRAEARSAHNLLYWRNQHWWGIGPSAHSHVDGRRWWNHDQLGPWADALAAGATPEAGSEVPDTAERAVETVMLGLRLAEGLPLDVVADRRAVSSLVDDGLVIVDDGLLVLTLRGRLLADHVVRELI
jgi:putative oxygen-independent coproporphyrinogen III oxidase